MWAVLVVFGLLAAAGAAFGLVLTQRVARVAVRRDAADEEHGMLRFHAAVRTGLEQTVVGTVRSLGLPLGDRDVDYGRLYLESEDDATLLVKSKSMIDRGLLSVLAFRFEGRHTRVEYTVLRLPGDDDVHAAVLRFEASLVEAVRRIDPAAEVRLSSTALPATDPARARR